MFHSENHCNAVLTNVVQTNREPLRGPLQFELISSNEKMYDTLFSLRESAKDLFAQVSKVFRIYNHNCIPAGHLDPLLEPKLLAQEFVVHESKLLRLTPISIVGFGFLMPNERMGYLAFSKYPTVLECCNKMIPVSIKDCWSYTGLLETFVKNCDNYSYAKCVESHISSCSYYS